MKAYEYTHVVGFAETNFLGNVYYVNHLAWQGRCREMFLRDHAPSILADLQRNLRMVTIRCACEYFHELAPFDVVIVRMRLGEIVQNRVTMLFEYWRKEVAAGAPAGGSGAPVAPAERDLNTSAPAERDHSTSAPAERNGAGGAPAARDSRASAQAGRPDSSSPETLVARGEQQIGCMLLENGRLTPTPVPPALREALRPFAAN